jgi:hypothetical protein
LPNCLLYAVCTFAFPLGEIIVHLLNAKVQMADNSKIYA